MRSAFILLMFLPLSLADAQSVPPPAGPLMAPFAGARSSAPVTFGAGRKACSDWLADEAKPESSDSAADHYWMAGFVSAYNWYLAADGVDIAQGLTGDDMKSSMHARCAAHPTGTVATAASEVIAILKARRK